VVLPHVPMVSPWFSTCAGTAETLTVISWRFSGFPGGDVTDGHLLRLGLRSRWFEVYHLIGNHVGYTADEVHAAMK
jgi:hypothetical protein